MFGPTHEVVSHYERQTTHEVVSHYESGLLKPTKAGKISLILELPLLPLKPSEYIVSCTISDGDHPVAILRATPELTILDEKNSERSAYHGVLNLPATLFVK